MWGKKIFYRVLLDRSFHLLQKELATLLGGDEV